MMTRLSVFLALGIAATTLMACTSTNTVAPSNDSGNPTGYWYLGVNGERQWRTFNPNDIPPPAPRMRKNYATSNGNGSGRG